jgi:two-component system cell cycle sensor histidine kinase/response regulator CckA
VATEEPSKHRPHKQPSQLLRESEERYRQLIESSHDFVWEVDENAQYTFASLQVRQILCYSPEEVLGKTPFDLMPPDDAARVSAIFTPLSEAREPFRDLENTNLHKDGHPVVLETNGVPVFDEDGRFRGYRGIDRDVTERRLTERLLQDEISRRRILVDQSTDGIVILDQDGKVYEANQQYARMLGYSMEEVYELHVWDWEAQFSKEQVLEMLRTVDENGDHIETHHRRKDGSLLEVEISTNGAVFEQKKFIFCVCRDITGRKRAEETIRESERLLREAEVVAGLGSYELDIAGGRWTSSEMLDALFGIDKAYEHSVEGWLGLVHPDDQAMMGDYFANEVLGQGRAFDKEYRIVRRNDGTESWVHGLGRLEFDGRGRPVKMLGTIQNITERQQAKEALAEREEQLRQSQKMEAVGQLAGGIAHDFNNLLAAILGYADLLLGNPELSDSSVRDDLQEIKRAGERASALTQQILAFSRRQALQPRVVSLNDVLGQIEPLLRRTIGEDIDLVTLLHPRLDLVEVDPHQFEQVLMNLVLNARDAMPSGGRLTLETANVELDQEFSRAHPGATPGSYVMMRVSDTGSGMDEYVRERMFEPFFTTKAFGRGTGLGLSTVYGIIRQSQGFIFADSEPCKGTRLEIYLPRSVRSDVSSETVIPSSVPATGTETVMVVEDEPALRSLIGRILGGAGYTVRAFASGQEALEALVAGESRADLLLTDVMLPGALQGHDLARAALASRPDLPVLYMSGYSRDALLHAGRLDEGVNLLEKPFTGETLAAAVRLVLNQARARA